MTPRQSPGRLSPALTRRLSSQVESWRRDLLTLDRRQKLVYFKHTKTASLEITSPSPTALFSAASSPVMVASAEREGLLGRRSVAKVDGKSETEVVAACRRLDLTSQQVYADRGFWTLYLGLGMLRWIDPADGKTCYAPIVLCPVDLKRSGSQSPYFLGRNDDDVVVNPALRLHLEKTFDIHLPALDLDEPDVGGMLERLGSLVAPREDWAVEHRTVMTTFSFHKEAIYRDLEDHESSVTSHPIVQLVALGADAPQAAGFVFATPGAGDALDDSLPPEDLVSILDADSSQRACILAAREGRSFVMDGPPGTGKSQTIANIVAELISRGRRVLFVSEKAAALDVVRDRLTDKGLGDFLLELHSHAATRKEVVKQLSDSLTLRTTGRGAFTEGEKRTLRSTRKELTGFAEALNEVRPGLEKTLFDVLGRVVSLEQHALKPLVDVDSWNQLGASRLDELLEVTERLANSWRPVTEGEDFPWREIAGTPHSRSAVDAAQQAAASLGEAARQLADRCEAVDVDLSLSWSLDLKDAERRTALLRLLEERPDVPLAWLTSPSTTPLRNRYEALRRAADTHDGAVAVLTELAGPGAADAIDPDACEPLSVSLTADLLWSPALGTTSSEVSDAVGFLRETPVALASVMEDARQVGAMLGVDTGRVSLSRAVELAHLAELGASATPPERSWFNPAVQTALDESTKILGSLVALVNERRDAIEQVFTPAALDADLHGLEVRFRESHRGWRAMGAAARADKRLLKSISVSGRADKHVRARLGEAVAWQKAELSLTAAEQQHAARLGSYYERTTTDFARLGNAIATARRAIELAGNDLNSSRMADQLGVDGAPDPRLTVVARRMLEASRAWQQSSNQRLGHETTSRLAAMPLDQVAALSQDAAEALVPVRDAMTHVADAAGRVVSLSEARTVHEQSAALSTALAALLDSYDEDVEMFGALYAGLTTDWDALSGALDWTDRLVLVLGGPARPRQALQLQRPVVLSDELARRVEAYTAARDRWAALFRPGRAQRLRDDADGDLAAAAELALQMADSCVTDVAEWDAHVVAAGALRAAGLEDVLSQLSDARTRADAVVPSVERAILQAWVESVISSDARLRKHRAIDRDTGVQRFRVLDKAQVEKANVAVAAACSARRPSSMTGTAAQLIRRESQKKSRHLPIRDLLARTHEVVQELKPCFMMSPLSVSQFLPGEMTFDTVIFDEASQVLPSDAINCIYRGAQLIVAGDEKQLPPTAFFAQAVSDDDVDEELDLFESVLNSCKSSMTSLPLTWHYRSQHESLITYSNYQFYAPDGERLQTFPGATFESPDLGVASYVVNGTYRRGTSRDNVVEAETVVDRLVFHRTHHPELSIGVVTFSTAQEAAISAAIERRAPDEPALSGLLDDHDRLSGFFVKNLENVQGDERDIIVFSIGYGPDEQGKFLMNFGPVARQGGWRRLNVAITRARRRVEVVSSFRAGEIREGDNESLAFLRGYLDFADRGMSALGEDEAVASDDSGGDLVDDVVRALTDWGYDVAVGVGSADYRLDLAVRHPDRPGEYVMAVECDGPSYATAQSARDRDRLRAGVLAGLGWNVHRVWSVSWYRDRRAESERLRRAIVAAVAGDSPGPTEPIQQPVELEVEDVDLDAKPPWAVDYVRCTAQAPTNVFSLSDVESRPALQKYLVKVLRDEAPVHRDVVYQRVRDAFHVGRIGARIKENIEFVAARVTVEGRAASVDPDGFYRLGPLRSVRSPASDDDVRTAGQTPPEEMDLAVAQLVRDGVTVEEEGLVHAVRQLFGWRRAGADIQTAVAASVDRCLATQVITRSVSGALRAHEPGRSTGKA